MKPQRMEMRWPAGKLVRALNVVIEEQPFSELKKRVMKKKLLKLMKAGKLELADMDTEWLYRLCAASLMLHDYHWFAWEWRSKWAVELATKRWVYPPWFAMVGPVAEKYGLADEKKKRVLVVAEQGLGDEIVFSSCYHELSQDVEEAWIEVDHRLIPIFERSFPENLHFVSRWMDKNRRIVPRANDYPEFHKGLPIDAFVMAGNVPKLYRHSVRDFPERKGFLIPDKEEVQKWGDWIDRYGLPRLGCSWMGRQGEIDRLDDGISLQYGVESHGDLTNPPVDLKQHIDSVFALIQAIGKVVTTTNAVAHMAGALGVDTDVIKPKPIYATDEDAFNNRVAAWWPDDYSDWYPTVKMHRAKR